MTRREVPDDDQEFIRAFEAAAIANTAFHHRDHVRLAWLYIRRDGAADGARNLSLAIRRFAAAHDVPHAYNETLTRFWARLVAHLVRHYPGVTTVDGLVAAYPELADKRLPYRHYRPETLASPEARADWIDPDLAPLPRTV